MRDNSDKKIAEQIFKCCDLVNKKILEVGCGYGRITSFLADSPQELIAIDPDPATISMALENRPDIDFRVGSGELLVFPDKYFDIVIFTLSLHHQDSAAALREASRVVKVNGKIVVIEPLVEGELERIFALVHNEDRQKLNTQEAILMSGLLSERVEMFTAEWLFSDAEDVCLSVFSYYGVPFSAPTSRNIVELLGEKSKDQPIRLLDQMVIHVMSKA